MADLKSSFLALTSMKYIDQAKWFLNGFWKEEAEKEAENIWKCTNKFIELDTRKKKEGNELDEFEAHKFLESLGETLTVVALREKLRKIDLDANGKMALLEYLMFKYNKGIREVIDAPQGENQEEVISEIILLEFSGNYFIIIMNFLLDCLLIKSGRRRRRKARSCSTGFE